MLVKNPIFLNTIFQFAGKFSTGILSFFSLLVLAQGLGVYYFGEYTKAITFIALFYIVSDFGINTVYLHEKKENVNSDFSKLLGLRLVIGLILIAVSLIIITVLTKISLGFKGVIFLSVFLSSWSILGFSIHTSAVAVFQKEKRFDKPALAQSLGSILGLLLLVFLFNSINSQPKSGVLIGAAVLSLSYLFTALISLGFLRQKKISIKPVFDFAFSKKILLLSLPLGLTLFFNIVYFRIDTLILSNFKSSFEVGAYGLAYKFFEFALVLPTFIMNSFYPDLLEKKHDQVLFWKHTKKLYIGLFVAALIMLTVIWFVSPYIIYIKPDFVNSIGLLRLLSLSIPIFYLTSPLMWYYVILKQQKKLIYIYFVSLVFNIIANIIFIPKYGSVGAAVITGITELIVLILGVTILLKTKFSTNQLNKT